VYVYIYIYKLPAFSRTRSFITFFTRARHLSLSSNRLIQPMPQFHLLKIRFNIIRLFTSKWSKWFLFSGVLTELLYAPLLFLHVLQSPPTPPPPPRHFVINLFTRIIFDEKYRSQGCSFCSIFYSPVTSSLLRSSTFLSNQFSNILSLCFSLNVQDHILPIQNKKQRY
jgi:hypothetical protein